MSGSTIWTRWARRCLAAALVTGTVLGAGAAVPAQADVIVQKRDASTGFIPDLSPSQVTSVVSANGNTTVFVLGVDRGIWYRTGTWGGAWTDWRAIPGTAASGGPSAVSYDGYHLDIVIRGTSGAAAGPVLKNTAMLEAGSGQPSGWTGWSWLGGYVTTAPAIASVGPNQWTVVARGQDGGIWQRVSDGRYVSEWTGLGGLAYSAPTVEVDNVNGVWRYLVSVVGSDLTVWQVPTRWDAPGATGSWLGGRIFSGHGLGTANTDADQWSPKVMTTGWGDHSVVLVDHMWGYTVSLGGSLTSTAAASLQSDGSVLVFARGTDNGLWMCRFAAGGTSGWTPLGGQLA